MKFPALPHQLRFLDSWRVWTFVAWLALGFLVIWLFILNSRLDDNIEETNAATKANTEAISFLCDTNAIIEALARQTIRLLKSQPQTPARQQTIVIFQGYVMVLQERAACVNAEKAAIG